jgi:HK97 family phage major capsid protein
MQAMCDDPKIVAQLIDNKQLPELIRGYAKATDDRGDIADIVRESVQSAMVGTNEITSIVQKQADEIVNKLLGEHGVNRPGLTTDAVNPKHNALYNPLAPGVAMDNVGTTNLGHFVANAWHKAPNTELRNQMVKISNDFSSKEPSGGGFLIPETYSSEVRQLSLEQTVVRQRAGVITMGTPDQLIPVVDDTSHASSVFGGFIFYWSEEAQDSSANATNAKFGRTKLTVHDQIGYSQVPNELMADAAGLNSWLMRALPQGLAYFEDLAFLTGNGVGQPLGIINALNGALISRAKESGQVAKTIVTENITNMYARMLPSSLDNAVWVVNQTTFPQLMGLTINVGTGGAPVMLMDIRSGPNITLLGRPVIVTEKVPALGSLGDINFIDFNYYLIGDRQAMSLDASEHVNFATNQTALRIIERVDGRPWIQSALTPRNGDTLSPFVQLAAR